MWYQIFFGLQLQRSNCFEIINEQRLQRNLFRQIHFLKSISKSASSAKMKTVEISNKILTVCSPSQDLDFRKRTDTELRKNFISLNLPIYLWNIFAEPGCVIFWIFLRNSISPGVRSGGISKEFELNKYDGVQSLALETGEDDKRENGIHQGSEESILEYLTLQCLGTVNQSEIESYQSSLYRERGSYCKYSLKV